MDWDQIENKWAAMTRRVRADWAIHHSELNVPSVPRVTKSDGRPGSPAMVADRQPAHDADAHLTMTAE